jgi:hypothetical protein
MVPASSWAGVRVSPAMKPGELLLGGGCCSFVGDVRGDERRREGIKRDHRDCDCGWFMSAGACVGSERGPARGESSRGGY